MRFLIALLLLLAGPHAAGIKMGSSSHSKSWYKSRGQSFAGPFEQDCNENHDSDLYRPIKQVMAEHPGLDGNCYFHWYASWLGDPYPDAYANSFVQTALQYSRNLKAGPIETYYLPNGERWRSHQDPNWGAYPIDDVMCYQMGWMKGQRLDAYVKDLADRAAWLRLTEQECARLPGLVGGIDDNWLNVSLGYMVDDNERVVGNARCLIKPPEDTSCTKATLEDWVYHIYPKCLLGGERLTGAAGQMAWCFARACVLEDNMFGHGVDCWPELKSNPTFEAVLATSGS